MSSWTEESGVATLPPVLDPLEILLFFILHTESPSTIYNKFEKVNWYHSYTITVHYKSNNESKHI